MTVQFLRVAAIGAVLLFTLIQRKRMMTELQSLQNSVAGLKTVNTDWMNFMDGFASKLEAIEAAVIARNPGTSDETILAQLAEAREALAAKTARLATVQSELVTRTEDLATATGLLGSANAELGEIKAGVLEAASAIGYERERVGTNVAVAVSMMDGMIKSGDPYNGLDKPGTDT